MVLSQEEFLKLCNKITLSHFMLAILLIKMPDGLFSLELIKLLSDF